jgi:hypothetical protein
VTQVTLKVITMLSATSVLPAVEVYLKKQNQQPNILKMEPKTSSCGIVVGGRF